MQKHIKSFMFSICAADIFLKSPHGLEEKFGPQR